MGFAQKYFFCFFIFLILILTFPLKAAFGSVSYDKQPPQTTVSSVLCDGTTSATGTYTCSGAASASITLSCSDTGGSGCDTTYYKTSSDTSYKTYSTPFTLTTANKSVSFYSVDKAGNIEDPVNSLTVTFNYTITGSIYLDSDYDGALSAAETVSTNKYTGACTVSVGSGTPSCSNGNYTISGLTPGTYNVTLSGLDANYKIATTNPIPVTISTSNVTGQNFGVNQYLSINGKVYIDNSHDCTGTTKYQDATIPFTLTSSSGTPTTDYTASGNSYSIPSLTPGTYTLNFTAPSGYQVSSCTGGFLSGTPTQAKPDVTIPSSPPSNATQNFYITPIYSISGYVYNDGNGNGTFENTTTDPAFSGATVSIGTTSVTTDATTGSYTFDNLTSGSYTVSITLPSGYKQVIALVTQPITVDSTTGNRTGINFLIQGFRISGTLWVDYDYNGARDFNDLNGNSIKDPGEPYTDIGYSSGTTIKLSGGASKTATTDANGDYSFDDLIAGDYTVTLDTPSNYSSTYTGALVNPWTILAISTDTSHDFSITPLYSISGGVYIDSNKDGIKQSSEGGYTGTITITITAADGTSSTGTLSYPGSGAFTISGLLANTSSNPSYTISYSGLPTGYLLTYPKPATYVVTVGQVSGYTCSFSPNKNLAGTPLNATCTNGSISSLYFGITDSLAWFQCIGADCRKEGSFYDPVPKDSGSDTTCGDKNDGNPPSSKRQAFIDGQNSQKGLLFPGSAIPDFGAGSSWQSAQVVGGNPGELFQSVNPNVQRTSYDYMTTTARQSGITPNQLLDQCTGGLTNCNLASNLASGIYTTDDGNPGDDDLTLSNSSNCSLKNGDPRSSQNCYLFKNNKQIVILVNGDLTIKENVLVPSNSNVTFAVKGDITVSKDVGVPYNISCDPTTNDHDGCNIEGYYSTDGNFTIEGYGESDCANATRSEKRLNIAGAIVVRANTLGAGGAIQNGRDLCELNLLCPSYTLTARPDFLLNAPEFIKHPNYVWQETAP